MTTSLATRHTENGSAAIPSSNILDDYLPSERMLAFCDTIAQSNLVPKEFRGRPADVLLAILMGIEVGFKPAQALQSIAVINGKPSVYGDAALALIKQHRDYESCEETITGDGDKKVATCTIKRKGEPPVVRTFSVENAKRAGLFSKEGPWKLYPDRMLQMRARGFAGRDSFPDALKGLSFAEEAMDIPAEPSQVESAELSTRTETVLSKIVGAAKVEESEGSEVVAPAPDSGPQLTEEEKTLKARDLRKAVGRAWEHVAEPIRKAILTREFGKASLLDLTVDQLDDFLSRTPELLPRVSE